MPPAEPAAELAAEPASEPGRRSPAPPNELAEVVSVEPWADPVIDQVGHDPRSSYAERYWLPVLGPSGVLLLRHLARRFDEAPRGFQVPTDELAAALGMGSRRGPSAAFYRTVERLGAFGFVQLTGAGSLRVRRRLPPLTRRQLQRLPQGLQDTHDEWVSCAPTPGTELMRRARALALSLLELGEDDEQTERQLHRWRFHPAVAHDALSWATSEHARRSELIAAALAAGNGSPPEPTSASTSASAGHPPAHEGAA
jgi:hypothetical protein